MWLPSRYVRRSGGHATAVAVSTGMDDDGSVSALPSLDATEALICARRTNLRMDRDRPVDRALIERLCVLATWAPNHHLTEPWRFAVITGHARAELGQLTAALLADRGVGDEAKLDKTRNKFLRAPVMVMVGCASSADSEQSTRTEDRDAVAAAIQNFMLGATASGLNTYWGSGPVCESPKVKALCGFHEADAIVAALYVGWPMGSVPVPTRTAPVITWVA